MTTVCEVCGAEYGVGQSPWCRDAHARVRSDKGFLAHFDWGLGHDVTGWGDVHKSMREQHLDYRDHPSKERTEQYFERAARSREARDGR